MKKLVFLLMFIPQLLYCQFFDIDLSSIAINQIDTNKMKQGTWIQSYDSCTIHVISFYKNDTLHGNYYTFWENGNLESWTEFNMGRLWNTRLYFDKEGCPLDYGNVVNGNGYIYNYKLDTTILSRKGEEIKSPPYPKKQIHSYEQIKNGLPDGLNIVYYENGNIYKYGFIKTKLYYAINTHWSYSWCVGKWYYFSKEGKLCQEILFDENGEVLENETHCLGFY